MAKVIITERDLTSNLVDIDITDIAYIPGFGEITPDVEDGLTNNPLLVTTINQFQKLFGSEPRLITGEYKFSAHAECWDPCSYTEDLVLCEAGEVDRSYVYAMELLMAGMPIYYERINSPHDWTVDPEDETKKVPAYSVEKLYSNLTGYTDDDGVEVPSIYEKLIDKGSFDIKYLTSGGWPVFDYVNTTTVYDHNIEMNIDGELVEFSEICDGYRFFLDKECTDENEVFPYSATCQIPSGEEEEDENVYLINIRLSNSDRSTIVNGIIAPAKDSTKTIKIDNITDQVDNRVESYVIVDRPIPNVMLEVCGQMSDQHTGRGDCIALIDHTNNPFRPLEADNKQSVFACVNAWNDRSLRTLFGSFGAIFTPWENIELNSVVKYTGDKNKKIYITEMDFPGSFAYLKDMALYVSQYSKNHEAVAGPIRGQVKNALPRTNKILTNTIADSYQTNQTDLEDEGVTSINAITKINPYGLVIWGNRTIAPKDDHDGVKATHFLNIRNMISDVRKICFRAARKYMFEQNTDVLWINFKSEITPILDKLKTSYGIKDYRIIKTKQENTKLWADIIIQPYYAVEEFRVNIVIQDEDISVEESEE